jgi:hypothetical protein
VPVVVGDLDRRTRPIDTRVGHDHVDPPEGRDGRVDHLGGVRRIGSVSGDGNATELGGDVLQWFATTPGDDHSCALRSESPSDRGADAGPAAGHHRHPSGQLMHRRQR